MLGLEQNGRQRGRQGERDDAGEDHGNGDGDGKLFVEHAGHAAQEGDRDKDGTEDEDDGDHRPADFSHRSLGGFLG